MTKVENIVRSFMRSYKELGDEWFQLLAERTSILLGEVTVEEADILRNQFGISSSYEEDMTVYRVDNLEKFKAAAVA